MPFDNVNIFDRYLNKCTGCYSKVCPDIAYQNSFLYHRVCRKVIFWLCFSDLGAKIFACRYNFIVPGLQLSRKALGQG